MKPWLKKRKEKKMNKCWTKQTIACLFFLAMISPITAQAVPANLEDSGRHLVPERWWQSTHLLQLLKNEKARFHWAWRKRKVIKK